LPCFKETALQLLFMAGISTVAALIACFVAGPESPATLRTFYDRVKPVGFWGPLSASKKQAHFEYSAMTKAFAATFLAAFSIFSLLTGTGSIIADSAAPVWFPYAWPWRILLIGAGGFLLPVWWKIGIKEHRTTAGSVQRPR
jgi:hypothetical protein